MKRNKAFYRLTAIIACSLGIGALALIGGMAVGTSITDQQPAHYEQLGVDDIDETERIFIDYQDGSSEIIEEKNDENPILENSKDKESKEAAEDDSSTEASWDIIDPVDDLEEN